MLVWTYRPRMIARSMVINSSDSMGKKKMKANRHLAGWSEGKQGTEHTDAIKRIGEVNFSGKNIGLQFVTILNLSHSERERLVEFYLITEDFDIILGSMH